MQMGHHKITFHMPLKNGYLFSQEAVSMSMLCDRDKLWDWVSRLLEGELERELTPSLLWLPYTTPVKVKIITYKSTAGFFNNNSTNA